MRREKSLGEHGIPLGTDASTPAAACVFLVRNMSSPNASRSPFRRASFALETDPSGPKGHSALATLLRDRTGPQNSIAIGRDEEGGLLGLRKLASHDDIRRDDERHLASVLNGPQMRSMRLIGNSNPRYKWERYWQTDDQLAQMEKKMLVDCPKTTNCAPKRCGPPLTSSPAETTTSGPTI